MSHFFQKRDRWGNGYGLWVVVGMAFLAPLAIWSCGKIHLENRVENWLPDDDPQAQILDWTHEYFAPEDRLLISWEGSALTDPRLAKFQEALQGAVSSRQSKNRKARPEITGVIGPKDVFERMVDGGVDDGDALERLSGVLIGRGPLRVRLTSDGKPRQSHIEQELTRRVREELDLELEILSAEVSQKSADNAESQNSFESPAERLAKLAEPEPHDFAVQWPRMHTEQEYEDDVLALIGSLEIENQQAVEKAFFQPGSPAALGVSISFGGRRRMPRTMEMIAQTAETVGIAREDLRIGGRPVVGNELNQGVKKAFWNSDYPIALFHKRSPLMFSALVGVILAFIMLRSLRLAILVLISANFTVLLTVALVPLTQGSMNMILVCMPTLLSVLTLSAAIHVANYWKHAAIHSPRNAVVKACRMAMQPCALASITTAVGLMSLTTSNLTPVRDFGFYAAIGCLISLLVVLFGLPAMLQFWPGKVPAHVHTDHERWKRIANWLVDYWKPVAGISIVSFLVCSFGLIYFRTETKVIRYFPDEKRVVQDYYFLEENLSGIVPVDVVVRFNQDAQERMPFDERREVIAEISEKIRRHPEVSGAISLADFMEFRPPVSRDGKPPSTLQKMSAHRKIHEAEKQLKNGEIEEAKALFATVREPRVLEKLDGRGFAVETGDELWRITAQVAIMSDLDYADLTGDWTEPQAQPGELNTIAESVLDKKAGAKHLVTGMVPLFLQTQQAVLRSLIISFGVAFLLIALIMMYLLRNPLSGLLTMIPNVLPVGMVFGLISWGGLSVDIGTMITASVALGIAVDGTLHLLSWYRKGLIDGMTRRDAIAQALMHCGPALWQTSMAVGIGLLMLFPAELLLVSRFGWLMAALIAAALVADLIVLPALLAGPLGRIIERTIAQSQREETAPAPSHPIPGTEVPQPQHGHLF